MSPQQERKFDEMHDAIIELRTAALPRLKAVEETLFGNGKPGVKEEVALCKKFIANCEIERGYRTGRSGNNIAICALVIATIAPFVALWIGS